MGPWTELGNPCRGQGSETTFDSQSTFVVPVGGAGDSFVLVADGWNAADLQSSTYVWLPIRFQGDVPHVEWLDRWDLSVFGQS